jgi:hypothetical protein
MLPFTVGGGDSNTIDSLLRTAQPLGDTEWAETGGLDGTGGTKNAPDPADGLTGAQFISLSTGVGAGTGASIAISTIGLEGLVAAGAPVLIGTFTAGAAGLASAGALGYGIGTMLNSTEWFQGLSNSFTDLLIHGPSQETIEHSSAS